MILTKIAKRCGELKYQPPSILTGCNRICYKWFTAKSFHLFSALVNLTRIGYLRSFLDLQKYHQILISGFSNTAFPEFVNKNLEKSFFYERLSIKICFFDLRIPYVSIHVLTGKKHGCSPVNLLHIFRTPFLKNTSGQLLLFFNSLMEKKYENIDQSTN